MKFLILILCAFLAACGGGGGDDPQRIQACHPDEFDCVALYKGELPFIYWFADASSELLIFSDGPLTTYSGKMLERTPY
jgi:hypothetical protein